MSKPTLEEILQVASFRRIDGKLIVTRLETDIIGPHFGDHIGPQFGNREGAHHGEQKGFKGKGVGKDKDKDKDKES